MRGREWLLYRRSCFTTGVINSSAVFCSWRRLLYVQKQLIAMDAGLQITCLQPPTRGMLRYSRITRWKCNCDRLITHLTNTRWRLARLIPGALNGYNGRTIYYGYVGPY